MLTPEQLKSIIEHLKEARSNAFKEANGATDDIIRDLWMHDGEEMNELIFALQAELKPTPPKEEGVFTFLCLFSDGIEVKVPKAPFGGDRDLARDQLEQEWLEDREAWFAKYVPDLNTYFILEDIEDLEYGVDDYATDYIDKLDDQDRRFGLDTYE